MTPRVRAYRRLMIRALTNRKERHILISPKPRRRRGQDGFALIAGGLVLLAMFALIVVAIDIGRISHTATEVQGIADSAAMAGALAVLKEGAGKAQPAATAAANDNRFDGQTFVDGTNGQLDVKEGSWDPSTASFTPDGSPTNAVRAIATGQSVRYVTAPLIPGVAPTSDIQKLAVAVIAAPSLAIVNVPLAICSSVANGVSPQPPGPCANGDGTVIKPPCGALPPNGSCLPDIEAQGTQNSCFSGLGTGANSFNEWSLLPAQCGGTTVATVDVGEIISLDNGQNTIVLQHLQNCVGPAQGSNANNVHRFVVPVINNCHCSGTSLPVAGFVEIQIDAPSQVITTTSNKRITGAKQICDSKIYGGLSIAAGDFGVKVARLAQ